MTRAARATSTTGNAARRSARPSATVVAALLTVGLLSACSGAETPQEDPGTTTTAPPEETSASPTPSATEEGVEKPERPAAMDKKNADGAAAAAEYFLSLRSYTLSTGDTSEWKAMSHKTCGYCESALGQAKRIVKEDDHFEGGEVTAKVTKKYQRDEATGIWPVDADVEEAAIRVTDKAGDTIFSTDTARYASRIEVGLMGDDWVIVEVADVPED
ncbi:DUF6318 family protein [Isoptericola cucumis]|uniref:DUF6318 domain-containing protein n=1 Tax=Isoptericola cucumis TaxID=1776856 RepID=A0ABQ2B7F8_9MICO|nr:DUF6318 family protein [Isoptericola cucumis]GGI07803.1 hypothetical protein GCM10007368_17990 [Isoptericola cucumis]